MLKKLGIGKPLWGYKKPLGLTRGYLIPSLILFLGGKYQTGDT